jgi:hypothetical protein
MYEIAQKPAFLIFSVKSGEVILNKAQNLKIFKILVSNLSNLRKTWQKNQYEIAVIISISLIFCAIIIIVSLPNLEA